MPFKRLTRRHALAVLASAATPLAMGAAAPELSSEDSALVARAVGYLESLSSAQGRFEQADARGEVTTGTFYLQRPGRARFDYDPPSGLAIASNGFKVTVVNRRLKTIQSYPLGMTPLGLFLAKTIRLDKGVFVSAVDRSATGFTITAHDRHKRSQGSIAMSFASQPVRLEGWTVTDARGQSVRVRLAELSPSPPQSWRFFELSDPARDAGVGAAR
jgi:outer membrane lipoprotein-sorting protein